MSEILTATKIEIKSERFWDGRPYFDIVIHYVPELKYYSPTEPFEYRFIPGAVGNHGQGETGYYMLKEVRNFSPQSLAVGYGPIIMKIWPNGELHIQLPRMWHSQNKPPKRFNLTPNLTTQFRNYIYNLKQPKNDFNENVNTYENELIPAVLSDTTLFVNFDNNRLREYINEGNDINRIDDSGVSLMYVLMYKAVLYRHPPIADLTEEGVFIMDLINGLIGKNVDLDIIVYGKPLIDWARELSHFIPNAPPFANDYFMYRVGNLIIAHYEENKRMKNVRNTVHLQEVLLSSGLPENLQRKMIQNYSVEPIRPGNVAVVNYLNRRNAIARAAARAAAAAPAPARAGAGAAGNARRAEGGRSRKHRGGAKKQGKRVQKTRRGKN